uniref:Uncharacterized protein n=1 Tax=Nelumbo nucifera TaxID=4432 RepID=A0A822YE34_NELNU|nr:TPA_asm: hypothetical protein HUJ06_009661 [Nelumbo nucifera]
MDKLPPLYYPTLRLFSNDQDDSCLIHESQVDMKVLLKRDKRTLGLERTRAMVQ